MMMAIAVDKGWCNYDDTVCQHWPEFAQRGEGKKSEIKICDVMRHEANMEALGKCFSFADAYPENIQKNVIGDIIEQSSCWNRPESTRTYHTFTKDMIANEVFRRVEPNKRTMGQYFKEEIEKQHGLDVYITMNPEDYPKHYPLR